MRARQWMAAAVIAVSAVAAGACNARRLVVFDDGGRAGLDGPAAIGHADGAGAGPRADAGGSWSPPPFSCADLDPEACLVGALFVDCPGPRAPALFCSGQVDCAWVSSGCPVPSHPHAFDGCQPLGDVPVDMERTGKRFVGIYGSVPWDRDRAFRLSAKVGARETFPPPFVRCSENLFLDLDWHSPCAQWSVLYQVPGTLWVRLTAPQSTEPRRTRGRFDIEIDFERDPPRARFCRVGVPDFVSCKDGDPVCAPGGEVIIDRRPERGADPVRLKFDVTFDDGVRVEGAL